MSDLKTHFPEGKPKFICSISDLTFHPRVREIKKKVYQLKASDWNTTFPLEECKSARYEVIKHTLKKGKRIDKSRSSVVEFDDDVTFTILRTSTFTWMSDTPLEIEGHRPAIKMAKGHVMVAGLGMGYVALEMAKKKSVEKITVVEIDQELIDLIYPRLEPHLQGKVRVVCQDLFKYRPKVKFDSIWFDIWRSHTDFLPYRAQLIQQFEKNCDPARMRFWDQRFVRR